MSFAGLPILILKVVSIFWFKASILGVCDASLASGGSLESCDNLLEAQLHFPNVKRYKMTLCKDIQKEIHTM